jgi:ribosomal protein L12E/L44/L45/RPP1/RPP2
VELIERENSEKISAVKKKAQDRIKVLTEKLDERYVSLRDHIKQLKQAIAEEQNNGSANKKRKIAPDVDDEEDEEEEKKDEEKDMEKDEEEDDEGEVDEPISKN